MWNLRKNIKAGRLLLALLLFLCASPAKALHIPVKRVILDEASQTYSIPLTNTADTTRSYRISWLHFLMEEDNLALTELPIDAKNTTVQWADDRVGIEQEIVEIPAGESLDLKLYIKSLPKESGEYRTHLWIREIAQTGDDTTKTGMNISTLTGIAIPVFLRKGDLHATATITNLGINTLPDGNTQANFTLHRSGNKSLFADLEFTCLSVDGVRQLAHALRGISVYTEVAHRKLSTTFPIPADMPCKSLEVSYRSRDDDKALLAQAATEVP